MFYPKDSYSHPVQLDLLFRQVRSSPFLPPAESFLLGSMGLRTALPISSTPIHKVGRATHASEELWFWAYVHACNPSTQKVEEGGSEVLIQGPVQKQNKTDKQNSHSKFTGPRGQISVSLDTYENQGLGKAERIKKATM